MITIVPSWLREEQAFTSADTSSRSRVNTEHFLCRARTHTRGPICLLPSWYCTTGTCLESLPIDLTPCFSVSVWKSTSSEVLDLLGTNMRRDPTLKSHINPTTVPFHLQSLAALTRRSLHQRRDSYALNSRGITNILSKR